eukprot:Nitzschia sp. Nitz4//scaffold17_size182527//173440//174333//NITZ4_001884-RA/size182527-processed-gene-0.110-mRNA-1//1//CDS//3329539430//8852//frame0
MLIRVRLNSFTIVDNISNQSLGIALFSTPSFMNHSCDPNVLHTFMYGETGSTPEIILTAIKDILPGQEIQISYMDCNAPFRHVRRDSLAKTYFFICECPRCQVECELDSDDLLKYCVDCTNKSQPVEGCPDCQKVKEHALNYTQEAAIVTNLMLSGKRGEALADMDRLVRIFENAKGTTSSLNSFAVQESGEWLLQAIQNEYNSLPDYDPREANVMVRAIQILGEILEEPLKPSAAISLVLRRNLQKFDAGKHMLSIDPNPAYAIRILQEVQEFTAKYYTENSPLMKLVREALEAAR